MPLDAIFYDTSILSNFSQIKYQTKFETAFTEIQKKGFLKAGDHFTISTPLLTLEVIGLGNAKKFINLHDKKDIFKEVVSSYMNDGSSITDVVSRLFSIIKEELSQHSLLQIDSIKKLAIERSKHCSDWWKQIVIGLFLRDIENPEFIIWFHESLAFELVQDIDFESILDFKTLVRFNTEWFHYFNHLQSKGPLNTVFCRRVLKYLHRKFPKEKGFISAGGDLADSLFIHYSLLGYKFRGQLRTVKIVTCESKETTRKRLLIYYSALDHINSIDGKPTKIKFRPGIICHINSETGKIANFTYVQKEIDNYSKNNRLPF